MTAATKAQQEAKVTKLRALESEESQNGEGKVLSINTLTELDTTSLDTLFLLILQVSNPKAEL